MESQPKGALLPQFYAGRSIFITGGTGFLGKVSCLRKVRSTSAQLKLLVDFMYNHVEFANNQLGVLNYKQKEALWSRLKALLARCGPDKAISQWKASWRDLKRRAIQQAISRKVDSVEMAKCIKILKARKTSGGDESDEFDEINFEENTEQFDDTTNDDDDETLYEEFQKITKVDIDKIKFSVRKNIRSTPAQLHYLREYMKTHEDFAFNRDTSFVGQKRYEKQWLELKQMLDQHGPEKSIYKWKATWRDIRRPTKGQPKSQDINNTSEHEILVDVPIDPSQSIESSPNYVKIKPIPWSVTASTESRALTQDIKVLIERLLATCPDIGQLHLLMRPKRDIAPEKRLLELKQSQVFDVVREKNPSQLDKLRMVPGDVSSVGLGLSQESLEQLKDVSIVFHSAATLKFDEALNVAVNQNLRSVLRIMDLCDSLPKMAAFIYVSTAYSNAEKSVIEEEVYPPPAPLEQLLAITDAVPEEYLSYITPKYISPKPNTYTFTKAVAESAVKQRPNTKYPVAIFRPSIVISSVRHPYPGWVENLNGPSGVLVAGGKGLLHVFICKQSARADLLPVDIAIDTLIATAWETASKPAGDVKVYNCSTYENPTNWHEFELALKQYLVEYPLDKTFWYPTAFITDNKYTQKAMELLWQTIPLHVAEYIARFLGIKTQLSLITVSQRLRAMNEVLMFFSLREWHFKTDNVRKLREKLSPEDSKIYNLDPHSIDWKEHYINFVKGTRKYLLKEKDEDIPEAKNHIRRMRYLHYAVTAFIMALVFRVLLQNNFIRDFVYGVFTLLLSLFK